MSHRQAPAGPRFEPVPLARDATAEDSAGLAEAHAAATAREFRRLQWGTYPCGIVCITALGTVVWWLVINVEGEACTSSSGDDCPIDLMGSWHAPAAWGITALWATYCIFKNGLPWGIGTELCCCPFAKNLAVQYNLRSAGLIRWTYWSSGLITGTMLVACSLPEIFVRYDPHDVEDVATGLFVGDVAAGVVVTPTFVLWWKLILGVGMVHVHSGMMKNRTIKHNHIHPAGTKYGGSLTTEDGALYNGRNRPLSDDGKWRAKKAVCQVMQVIHWAVWIPVFIKTGRDASRPPLLVALDGGAISLIFTINILRALCYFGGYNTLFWLVRSRDASAPGNWNDVMETPGVWEPWVQLVADPTQYWNWKRLDEQMMERADLYEDDNPMTASHREWTFGRTLSELQLAAIKILQQPKTTCLDNHTKIFIFLTNMTVNGGREKCLVASDIKLPFDKQELDKDDRLGGLQFARSDEFFMDSPSDVLIGFDWKQKMALDLVSKLGRVDEPHWFADEYEGIVHMEAVMRQFLPPPSDPWKEMHTDAAMSKLAFAGIGQLYILHVSAFKKQRESPQARGTLPLGYTGELPAGSEYVLDLTMMKNYAVREQFCHYGGAAFFDKDRVLLGIFCCDLPTLDNEPIKSHGQPTGKLVLAKDNEECWDFVKFSLRSTLTSLCTLRDHLVFCHWIVSNRVSIASRETLNKNHPLRRVLKVFTFRSAAINFMSATTLMENNMLLHRASAFTSESLVQAFEDCVENFQYTNFPDEVASRGMPQGTLPLVEDGMLVWNNFKEFFTGYVNIFYAGDTQVLEDEEVKMYWASLERASTFHRDGDKYNGYGLPELSKQALINQLTHTAFWVTGMHEFSGSIVEMFESPRNCATKILRQGPLGPDGKTRIRQSMADVQTYFQDMCIIGSTGYRLPLLKSDWTHLFLHNDDSDHPGTQARCKELHKKLMESFNATAAQIWRNNRKAGDGQPRLREFTKMNPSLFETSVSI